GASDRSLSDHHKGYVKKFGHYVKDLEQLLQHVVYARVTAHPIYLLAHSMGGAVGAHYMASHPNVFKKAVLSSPMMEINTKPYSEIVARNLSKLLVLFG